MERGRLDVGIGSPRNAEVEDLWFAFPRDKNVAGLEIAVNDAFLVRVLDGVTDSGEQFEPLAHVQVFQLDVVGKALTVHRLHREKGLEAVAGVGRAGLKDLRNAGVLKPAQQLGFMLEASQQVFGCEPGSDDFQGDFAPRVILLRPIHDAHAAFTQDTQYRVIADAVWERCHGGDAIPNVYRGTRCRGSA